MSPQPAKDRPSPRNRPRRPAPRDAGRSVQRSRAGISLSGVLIVSVVVGILAVSLYLGFNADATASDSAAKSAAPVLTATEAHETSADCAQCHEAPNAPHFGDECTDCHSTKRAFAEPQLSHVTFGAHTQATQACDSCHTDKPASQISCRACHGNDCGKGAKTAEECIKCHRSGTTDRWVP